MRIDDRLDAAHVTTLVAKHWRMTRARNDLKIGQQLHHISRSRGWDTTVHQRELYQLMDAVTKAQDEFEASVHGFFAWIEIDPIAQQIKAVQELLKRSYADFIAHKRVQKWIGKNASVVSLVMSMADKGDGKPTIEDGVQLYEAVTNMTPRARDALVNYAKFCNRNQGGK